MVGLELLNTYRQEEENALRQASGLSQLLAERLAAGISEAGLILQSSGQLPQVQTLLHTGKAARANSRSCSSSCSCNCSWRPI